jgi:hypothetical protein
MDSLDSFDKEQRWIALYCKGIRGAKTDLPIPIPEKQYLRHAYFRLNQLETAVRKVLLAKIIPIFNEISVNE